MERDLKVVRLYRFDADSKVKAFADIAIGDFIVKGLRIVQGVKGLFVSMPQDKAKDGKWYNSFYPATKEARQELMEALLEAYQQ
ncbi:MAG: SpoVG family protein [Candidatus Omnitrophica bacterium]|nr:SpoVG family protein [Candidatus Omnitrophota bacterium]